MSNVCAQGRVGHRGALAVALALLLGSWGCTLGEPGGPDPVGPSDNGVSVDLNATPDTVNADGVSSSYIRLILRDNRGEPLGGHAVWFTHSGDGYLFPSPASIYVGPVQTGFVMSTDRNGVADVVYIAGTGVGCLQVFVRPYGTDTALTPFDRQVQLCQI